MSHKAFSMLHLLCTLLLSAALSANAADAASASAYSSKRLSTPEDLAAIRKVLDDFMSAIASKDGKLLSTLILNSRILFTSPGDQTSVDSARKLDVNFDGIGVGGFGQFSRYISTTPDKIRETFQNVEIAQDGPFAWVVFDYEFFANDKVGNYGVEHWQLRKTDGRWKIFSVVWTQHEPPK